MFAGDTLPIDVYCHLPVMCEDRSLPYAYVPSKVVSFLNVYLQGLRSEITYYLCLIVHAFSHLSIGFGFLCWLQASHVCHHDQTP